ncbi:MAG: bifunctional 5,10-methylenetetrahydrofolate dehydrogenase/5,10-methenyltetrahydrofolate cyclohydrolase [Methanobacteriota archaeon]|nr:MAG: bifunctional 5,10-methylenetetrahydrofolate dehydrogenase/5,10-methenyltetrahydrofolate cyclohydrolase [Euryarchaeota archaeon]
MSATIIDGKAVADAIKAELKPRVEALTARGRTPGLAAVLVGDDPASQVYVKAKAKGSEELGIHSEVVQLPADTTEDQLLKEVAKLNNRADVHGILVQQPLPAQIRTEKAVAAVSPLKDVDCFHPVNVGLLLIGTPRFVPATPAGVQELLLRSGNDPAGKRVTILGRSNIVGKPLAALLVQKGRGGNATVTVAHSATKDIAAVLRTGEIIVVAIGQPRFVKADMVRKGAVVIDVGINRVPDSATKSGTRLVGDVDFDAVKEVAAAITPVPGGVGPMTIAMLLTNTIRAAEAVGG